MTTSCVSSSIAPAASSSRRCTNRSASYALEALAAGAPLIVARTGGLAELIVDTDAGLTFEPGNPEDLAHVVEMVLRDSALAQQLAENARRLIETKYAWNAVAKSVAHVYDAAIAYRRVAT